MSNSASEMGFLDHLEELRWRIVKVLVAVILGSILSFGFIDPIIKFLKEPAAQASQTIRFQTLTVQGMFLVKWFIAIFSGFVISMPVTIFQIWKFVSPGLRVNEKKYIIPVVFFSFTSFVVGAGFGYYILVPFSLEFFSSMGQGIVENNYSISYYFSFLGWLIIGSGLLFQMPVVSLLLSAIGVLTPPFMRHYRRHSIVVILILSSFITPPDPVSMVIMSAPLLVLYEISIWVSWLVNYRREPI